ncbi:hypothetical protein TNCV_1932821 [Trichonephila clavipes]|nr:hypothetical protein TNCV_1932821 [Trichonephila clavipes]
MVLNVIGYLKNIKLCNRFTNSSYILKILKRLSLSRQIHFQWIPYHVNVVGNEIADSLTRASAEFRLRWISEDLDRYIEPANWVPCKRAILVEQFSLRSDGNNDIGRK